MNDLFVRILNVGIAGGWIALGVLLLRPLLKRTPRWVFCLLWAVVALRLLLPFTLYSSISLQPSTQVIPADIATSATPAINSGISSVNEAVNPVLTEYVQPETNNLEDLLSLGAKIWLAGVGLLLCYSFFAYLRVAYQVRIKVAVQKQVYICDNIDSPFVLGVVFPRIYLPSELTTEQQKDVLAHEYAHLKRRDHWWKPLGFLLLSIYWFNPLLWFGYILLCRDIEQACDEKVIASMTPGEKSHYAQTLLQCSVRRHMVAVCPVAFGEVGVKQRIKTILHYKNPGFWVVLLSLLICTTLAVCFLTDPLPCEHDYNETVLSAPSCTETGRNKQVCRKCDHSYVSCTPEIEHHYEDGEVLTKPTCTTHGVRARVCTDCGHTVTAKMEMTQHIPGTYTVTEASTCSHKGVASTNCVACGFYMTAPAPVNPQAHSLQEIVLIAPTCTEAGEGLIACRWCTYEEKCTYEKHGHQFVVKSIGTSNSVWRSVIYECEHCKTIASERIYTSGSSSGNVYGYCSLCGFTHSLSGTCKYSNPKPSMPVIIWDYASYNRFN